MDTQVIKQILNKDFYENNKARLSRSLFDDEILELYDIIVESHKKYNSDITPDALQALWEDANPTATRANKASMADVVKQIDSIELMDPDIAADLLNGLWRRDIGRKIANLGIALSEGKQEAYTKLETLLQRTKDGFAPDNFGEDTTKDLSVLLDLTSDDKRFRFNIPALSKRVYGIGRGEFGIVFARPETGKTAFGVSICAAPGGFADQNLNVGYLGNEEITERTMLRAFQSWSGMTKAEITAAPELAMERFEMISDNITMKNIMNWDITEVESYIDAKKFDIVIADMADKIGIAGHYERPDLRLRELYTGLREIPKRRNCALLAFSQASAEAEGKTVITPDMMEGSKTGKFAEADLILGVGKYADNVDGEPNPIRFITVGKNKLSGWHGTITCKLEGEISRYVD